MDLPRGTGQSNLGTPTATARWATPEEVLKYRHAPGAIYLGTEHVPHPDAVPAIAALRAADQELLSDDRLTPEWVERQRLIVRGFIEDLERTDTADIGSGDDRHLVTIAGSRSGKLTTVIAENLCTYPGSLFTLDPKGELSRLTALRRGRGSERCEGLGQRCHVVDGYRVSGLPDELLAAFNPIDLLDPGDELVIDKAASVIEAIVIRSSGHESHFDDTATSFLKGVLLFMIRPDGAPANRNLQALYELVNVGLRDTAAEEISRDDDPIFDLLYSMSRCDAFGGVVAAAGNLLLDMGERERGSVLSTARRNLEFMERPAIRQMLGRSTFRFDELKTDAAGVSIFFCLPNERKHDCQRVLRLAVACGLQSVYSNPGPAASGHPVLFVLEEFASLGHMEMIENAAGYAAGFGLKLWVILQDLAQLKRHYKDGWETFLGNAGVIQAFGNSDLTTLEYLSKKLGQTEVIQPVQSTTTSLSASSSDPGEFQRLQPLLQSRGAGLFINPLGLLLDTQSQSSSASTTSAVNHQVQKSSLMQPDEIERAFRREAMTQVVLVKGERPMALRRRNYFDNSSLLGRFEPDRPPYRTLTEARARREEHHEMRAAARKRLMGSALGYLGDLNATVTSALKQRG